MHAASRSPSGSRPLTSDLWPPTSAPNHSITSRYPTACIAVRLSVPYLASKLADFFHQPRGEHLLDAGVDPPVQLVARPGKHEDLGLRGRPALVELRLQVAQPLAGELEDFQAADDPPLVVADAASPPAAGRSLAAAGAALSSGSDFSSLFDLPRETPNPPADLDRRPAAATSDTAASRRRTALPGRGS